MAATKPRASIGQVSPQSASQKETKSPLVICCSSTSRPPYQKTMSTPTELMAPMSGPMEPRSLASARLFSR